MKYFFKKHIIWIVSFSLIALITLGLVFLKTDYELQVPAGLNKVGDFIDIDNVDEEQIVEANISTVSIYSFQNVSLINYIIGKINPFADLYEISNDVITSNDYVVAQGTLHKNLSCTNAVLSAYNQAGFEISSLYRGFVVTTLYNYCQSDLKVGDIITEICEVKLTDKNNISDILKELKQQGINQFNAKIIRGTKEQFVNLIPDNQGRFGFGGEAYYSYPSVKDGPKFTINSVDTLGPSGGLMQALYIYEQLTGAKLTEGLKIAGTGTIDPYGNAGLIGGMKQKIYIANASNVDIFFVPIDMSRTTEEQQNKNLTDAQEAMKVLKKFGQDNMKIVPVKNLEEAIKYLEGLK